MTSPLTISVQFQRPQGFA